MKKLILLFDLLIFIFQSNAKVKKLYDISADPSEQLQTAVKEAKKTDKHIMIQIGGNWCPWCFRFHDFHSDNKELDSMMSADYILINVNYDPKLNNPFFAKLDYPQRFGFPVIVILNKYGNRLHTQDSWYLEDGKDGYDYEKFKTFLRNWTPAAVKPSSYK